MSPKPSVNHQLEVAREGGAAPGAPPSARSEGEVGAIPLSAEQAGRIESLLGRAAFASWFRDCAWRQGDGGRYPGGEIVAPTQFMADYIATQFGSKVGEAFGGRVRVIAADRRVGSPSPAAPVQ